MKHEIQTRTFGNEWVNTWTETDEHGGETPVTFATLTEAREALLEYLEDQHNAVDCGDMAEKYSPDDFRIVEIAHE